MEDDTITMVEGEEEWRLLLETAGTDRLVVVDFYAVWCGPCRVIAPVYERLSREYASSVVFLKVDVDRNPGVSAACGVSAMPTFQFFKNGARIHEMRGANASELERLVALHSGALELSAAPQKRYMSFPPDLYAYFEGERNIEPVWNKLVQFNNQLEGKEGHMNAGDLARLKSLFVLTLNTTTVGEVHVQDLGLLDRLLGTWPPSHIFPVVDILRRVALFQSAADYFAKCASDGQGGSDALSLVLRLLESDSSLGNVLMSIRFLANCFQNLATRKLVAKNVTALRLVKQQRAHDNKQVRLAVATFLLNYAKASACDSEGSAEDCEQTLGTLASCLEAEQDDECRLRFVLALGTLLLPQTKRLAAVARDQLALFQVSPSSASDSSPLGLALTELRQLLAEK